MKSMKTKFIILFLLSISLSSCFIKEKCYSNEDCTDGKICNKNSGECVYECKKDSDCKSNFVCQNYRCIPSSNQTLSCPPDMANIENTYCIDKYEASRPDATESFAGVDNTYATSRRGVLPWQTKDNKEADEACRNAGKRLCSDTEWFFACSGRQNLTYSYGNKYNPSICNGIDAFCNCDSPECSHLNNCPYPHCYDEKSLEGGGPCGSSFRVMPTGSFEDCKNEYGVYDLNGNVWEHILNGSEYTVRGGAYNCQDSEMLHRCDYIPVNWKPSALGFRCCISRETILDAGREDTLSIDDRGNILEDVISDIIVETLENDSGCIEDDILIDVSDVMDLQNEDRTDVEQDAGLDVEMEDIFLESEQDGGIIKSCPEDMANIDNRFCIDKYEASRPDATEFSPGSDNSYAVSKKGVIPWYPINLAVARDACQKAGKRLCRMDEWYFNCAGNDNRAYVYGNTYNPTICNSIDTYCYCDNPACSTLSQCPYPHCYNQVSNEGGGPCGAAFRVMPTGSFPDCVNEYGVYDINGNVWEIVDTDDGLEHFRGGAYNCGDSEMLHKCDYDATWGPSAKGFRCCKDL